MKKRIVCVLLTLIMLMSLVPMTASAAGNKVSEAAITVLKQFEGYNNDCWEGTAVAGKMVYYTGYGTVCTKEHDEDGDHIDKKGNKIYVDKGETILATTTQAEANEALRSALSALDEKINAFAASNGLSLNQNEHDALVIFSYDAGAGWITASGVVRDAIINDGGVNDLLNAVANWANAGTLTDRRKCEVNMYINGVYSNTAPANYTSVTYDANGGVIAQSESCVYYYDSSKSIDHPVTPTNPSHEQVFLGWYDENGKWAPALTAEEAGTTLTAVWAGKDETTGNSYELDVAYINPKIVYKADLKNANTTLQKLLTNKKTVTVYDEYVDTKGQLWCQIDEDGEAWVKVTNKNTGYDKIGVKWVVTVTNSYVNRRVNASAFSAKNGSYKQGAQLEIIGASDDYYWLQVGEKTADGSYKAVGWVAHIYTNFSDVRESELASANGQMTATVTYNGYLNIRSEAGTDNKIVGALAKGDIVEIYEIKIVNGHQWGKCSTGWICLTYTSMDLKGGSEIAVDSTSYIFTGTIPAGISLYSDASENAELYHELAEDTAVKILTMRADASGATWGKACWYVDNNNDGKAETPLYGWFKLEGSEWKMDPAKYTVVAEQMNVRNGAGDGYTAFFKLSKGVEVQVTEVVLVGENIWGRIPAHDSGENVAWINLASKYVVRGNAPTVESNTSNIATGLSGTVINADSLKVRKTGATYATIIGSLSRGTTVAVWESNADKSWYKVDSNKNGTYDYEGDGWVSAQYLSVSETTTGNDTVTDLGGNTYQTDGTGTGIVANTYAGVNVRQGAGTGYATTGKLLPGTVVEILEVTTKGASKWGRVAQGWICMDYVTMMTYNEIVDNTTNIPEGGISVDSYDDVEKTTTTAVYTGTLAEGVVVYNDASTNADVTRTSSAVENVTIHELAAVKTVVKVESEPDGDSANNTVTTTTTTETTFWARINDGWVQNPQECITLNALDEKVHTVTGSNSLNMRTGPSTSYASIGKLKKGDKVTVTSLQIENDKVWGRFETEDGTIGWARLDYMSEGAIYVNEPVENTPNTNVGNTTMQPTLGNTSSVGGFVTNASGYRYTGKVIRANEVNVRSTPSTAASKTTSLKNGAALVIYETTVAENMAWGRCDAGWIYLYYVDLVPVVNGAVDARVVYNDNTIIYTDVNCTTVAGTYSKMAVIDIYEIVGKMARTEMGWVNTDNLL